MSVMSFYSILVNTPTMFQCVCQATKITDLMRFICPPRINNILIVNRQLCPLKKSFLVVTRKTVMYSLPLLIKRGGEYSAIASMILIQEYVRLHRLLKLPEEQKQNTNLQNLGLLRHGRCLRETPEPLLLPCHHWYSTLYGQTRLCYLMTPPRFLPSPFLSATHQVMRVVVILALTKP